MTATDTARPRHEPRVEDDALVRGAGHFVDDPRLPNQAYAAFVRSPHAHARVVSVNADEARKAKGVLAVLTAEDIKEAGIGSIARHPPTVGRGGAKMVLPFRPALAGDKVMHVGDPVAMVVAETAAAALDAADLVQVDYEELPPVVDLATAMKAETQLFSDAPGNLCVDWPGWAENKENEREVADIIAKAPHVARVSVVHQRLVVASMETRGATGAYDKDNDAYTLARLLAERRRLAQPGRLHHGRAERQIAGDHRRRRRRFRHEDDGLSGIHRGDGGRAQARPAGALAIDALGSLHERLPGARRGDPCRACARRQGQVPRLARAPSVQPGRLRRQRRRQHQHQ